MVQQGPPLHLLLRQREIGERIRAGGDEECRGCASDVPGNLRERVHGLEGALEQRRLQASPAEGADVVEGDGGRGQDGVERRDLLADEMVLGLCVERGPVCLEVGVPPPLALDVGRGRRGGGTGRCMDDSGHDGGGEGEACRGGVEVEDGGFAFCVCVRWWLGSLNIPARNYWGVRARCIVFYYRRVGGCCSFTRATGLVRFRDARLLNCYRATIFLRDAVNKRETKRV